MQPQRKPVNLFAIRCRERTDADAVPANAMNGMDEITEGVKGTSGTHGQLEIRDGVNELEITEAGMESAPWPLPHSVHDISGSIDSPADCAVVSSAARTHQSVSLKPDGEAQCGMTPAANSALSGICFLLKDGSSIPLSSQIDERQLSVETLAALKQLAEIFHSKPHTRLPAAEFLTYAIRRCIHKSQKAA